MSRKFPFKVAIIGGGISGLICASELSRLRPFSIVLEKEKEVGGKVRSISEDGYTFDIGFHLLLGGYSCLLPLLNKAGVRLRYLGEGAIWFHEGRFYWLERSVTSILKFALLPFSDRVRLLTSINRHLKCDIDYFMRMDEEDLDSWARKNLSGRVLELVYDPLVRSTALLKLGETSAGQWLLAEKLRSMDERGLVVYYPEEGGLNTIARKVAWHASRMGSEIWTGTEVKRIVIEGEGVVGVEYVKDGVHRFLRVPIVVYAGPITSLFDLVEESHFPDYFRERVKRFSYTKATAVYLGLDKPVTEHRVAILLPGMVPSICGQLTPPHGVLSPYRRYLLACTIQGEEHFQKSDDEIVEVVTEELSAPFGSLQDHVVWSRVLRIDQALEAQKPGILRLKFDTNRTPLKGLYMAGNYTNNDFYYSCIEGAARSARNCAQMVEEDAEILNL
ncbi:MAG: FAD-dependent oxidoreductase [Candidatus Bathyarchaeia archaeon]